MAQQTAAALFTVLDARVTAGMCQTTLKAIGRRAVLVGNQGVVVGIASAEHLASLARTPGAGNRPLRDACRTSGLLWL